MRRHPNPPGCAVAGALARRFRARRAASTPASRRDARLLPRAGTDLSARRHRRGRARGRTRRPAPGSRARVPVPSRRPTCGVAVDAREAVRGWTDEPNRRARPRRRTRLSPRASATLHPRRSPRARETPDRRGPSRTGASDPLITNRSRRVFTLRPKKKIAFLISVDRFFSRRLALHHARRRPPSGHTRVVRRVPHDRLGRDRAGDVQQHLQNQCFKATSAVVPKESIRRASGAAAALGVCAAKPSTRAIPVTPAAGVVTAAAATTVPPVTTESMKVRDSAILVTPTARRAK